MVTLELNSCLPAMDKPPWVVLLKCHQIMSLFLSKPTNCYLSHTEWSPAILTLASKTVVNLASYYLSLSLPHLFPPPTSHTALHSFVNLQTIFPLQDCWISPLWYIAPYFILTFVQVYVFQRFFLCLLWNSIFFNTMGLCLFYLSWWHLFVYFLFPPIKMQAPWEQGIFHI